jgi:hypothetical protein
VQALDERILEEGGGDRTELDRMSTVARRLFPGSPDGRTRQRPDAVAIRGGGSPDGWMRRRGAAAGRCSGGGSPEVDGRKAGMLRRRGSGAAGLRFVQVCFFL